MNTIKTIIYINDSSTTVIIYISRLPQKEWIYTFLSLYSEAIFSYKTMKF